MELVTEYSAWAAALRERGRLETGEQLAAAEILLVRQADSIVVGERGPAAEAGALTGLFVIRAASESEALSIARTCPHLKYGGRVVCGRSSRLGERPPRLRPGIAWRTGEWVDQPSIL